MMYGEGGKSWMVDGWEGVGNGDRAQFSKEGRALLAMAKKYL